MKTSTIGIDQCNFMSINEIVHFEKKSKSYNTSGNKESFDFIVIEYIC